MIKILKKDKNSTDSEQAWLSNFGVFMVYVVSMTSIKARIDEPEEFKKANLLRSLCHLSNLLFGCKTSLYSCFLFFLFWKLFWFDFGKKE